MRCEVVSSTANSLTKQKYFRLCAPMVNRTKKKKVSMSIQQQLLSSSTIVLLEIQEFFLSLEVMLYAYGLTTVPQSG